MVLEQWSFAFKTGFCKCIGRKTNQKDIPLHHHHHHQQQQQRRRRRSHHHHHRHHQNHQMVMWRYTKMTDCQNWCLTSWRVLSSPDQLPSSILPHMLQGAPIALDWPSTSTNFARCRGMFAACRATWKFDFFPRYMMHSTCPFPNWGTPTCMKLFVRFPRFRGVIVEAAAKQSSFIPLVMLANSVKSIRGDLSTRGPPGGWGRPRGPRVGWMVFPWFLGGGFKYFLFSPLLYLGKIPNLTNISQMGWNHQPDLVFLFVCILCDGWKHLSYTCFWWILWQLPLERWLSDFAVPYRRNAGCSVFE